MLEIQELRPLSQPSPYHTWSALFADWNNYVGQILCASPLFFSQQTYRRFHLEHHVYPSVPFHHLPRVHVLMSERGSLPTENVYQSYWDVLGDLIL